MTYGDIYDDYLGELHDDIGHRSYAEMLRAHDPTAYETGFRSWINSNDAKIFCDNCGTSLEDHEIENAREDDIPVCGDCQEEVEV